MTNEREKRFRPRARIAWPVVLEIPEGTFRGIIRDVSSTGVLIECESPLRFNQVFDMLIEVPFLEKRLKATVQVVRSNIDDLNGDHHPTGVAVRFLKISGADRKMISEAVLHYLKLEGITADDDTLEIVIDPDIK